MRMIEDIVTIVSIFHIYAFDYIYLTHGGHETPHVSGSDSLWMG